MVRPGGRRKARRDAVAVEAAALSLEGSRSVVIEDVTATGARLRSRLGRTGQQLLLRTGPVEVLATVIWSRADECGVAFDEALDGAALEFLNQHGRRAEVQAHTGPRSLTRRSTGRIASV